MKIVCAFLLLGVSLTVFGQSDFSKQTEAVNPPFKLEITANLDKEHSNVWDFVNCAETTVKAGSMIVIAIRKTNISDHEIDKSNCVGDIRRVPQVRIFGPGKDCPSQSVLADNYLPSADRVEGRQRRQRPTQQVLRSSLRMVCLHGRRSL